MYQIISANGQEQSEENSSALIKYTEEYDYDDAANLYKITHTANGKETETELIVADKSNRAVEKDSKYNTQSVVPAEVDEFFDKNGNIQQIKNLNLNWNVYNQLHQTKAETSRIFFAKFAHRV